MANLISFGEYRPDVADYQGQHTKDATNVVPQGDGYGPFPSFAAFSSALPGQCRGFFYALKNDGTIAVFAATSTNLYLLNSATQAWTNVSKGGGPYTALSSTAQWDFEQFNNFILATQVNVPVQVYDLTASSAFADLGGSPPQAAYITVVNQFVVLSGLASPNVYRVQWSGNGSVTSWTAGINQSDFQDLADGGICRGVSGGDVFGLIFQDRMIRRMTYAPGSPYIFGIDKIAQGEGLYAPYSIINSDVGIFYLSTQGFKMWNPGANPTPIGKERVDRTFFNNVDTSNLQLIIGCADPTKTRVYWAYKSQQQAQTMFDTILCYDWVLDRWSSITTTGEYFAPLAAPGLTLEQTDAAFGVQPSVAVSSITTSTSALVVNASNHGMSIGQGIYFGTNVVGLTAATPYYISSTSFTTNSFKISAAGGVGALQGALVGTTSSATTTSSSAITFQQGDIDTLNLGSFDSISIAQLPAIAAVDANHKAGFFNGPTLQATLESAEHGDSMRRIFISGFRPITDAPKANIFGSLSEREAEENASTYTTEQITNAVGIIPCRATTRYARAKIRITAASTWTFAAGIEPIISLEGQR